MKGAAQPCGVCTDYQFTAFTLGDSVRADRLFAFEDEDPIYTRRSNPTVDVLEKRLAELHGAAGAIALPANGEQSAWTGMY